LTGAKRWAAGAAPARPSPRRKLEFRYHRNVRRAPIAVAASFTLLAQALTVRRAEASDAPQAVATTAAPRESDAHVTVTGFRFSAPPNVLEAAAGLARTDPPKATPNLSGVAATTPKAIMSSNTKTVVIVAIIAGAVLILVGVIAVGKPFGKP